MALGCSAPELFTNVGSVIFSSDSTTNPISHSLSLIEATTTLIEPQPDWIGLDWIGLDWIGSTATATRRWHTTS